MVVTKNIIKTFILQAIAGFIYWTIMLTPYMLFVVGMDSQQYFKWLSGNATITPILSPFSVMFINWITKLYKGSN